MSTEATDHSEALLSGDGAAAISVANVSFSWGSVSGFPPLEYTAALLGENWSADRANPSSKATPDALDCYLFALLWGFGSVSGLSFTMLQETRLQSLFSILLVFETVGFQALVRHMTTPCPWPCG